ncbi:MAG TPA: acyl-CoA thioesterase/bile acid-CoA:amino acid N-acyltransferase family protein [Rubrobacter sp.]|nr:acyl-CoA thioesterase/bile acid-CoA:amino acid N-acyltransferase family protein [Rubrobacter sp.]
MRVAAAGVAATACGGLLTACGDSGLAGKLRVTPNPVKVDEPFTITLKDLSPWQRVNLHARFVDGYDIEWTSRATFRADLGGTVDVSRQAPLEGSYRGTEPMGLVWSAYGLGTSYAISLRPQPLSITAEIDGKSASVQVVRTLLTDEIACTEVRERGLYGRFFRPATGEPVPGVLVLGGSEGGLASYVMREAALLANHGFAALALAYFYFGSLPDRLARIPLEYFGDAIGWLRDHPSVRGDRLGVMGTARGGELALLLGAHYPELNAVVSYVGSGIVFPSPAGSEPAWTFRGKPLPQILNPFDILQARPAQIDRAQIRVERTSGPVLLISGDADQVWPSTQLSRVAMDRLQRYGRPYHDDFRHYPDAGHGIQPPYLPATPGTYYYGGDLKGNATANEDSWQHVLRLLDERLRRRTSDP